MNRLPWLSWSCLMCVLLMGATMAEAKGIDEVNLWRTRNGLRPFVEDAELTKFAQRKAEYRAARLLKNGHQGPACPAGCREGTGEATADWGWLTCVMEEDGHVRGSRRWRLAPTGSVTWCSWCAGQQRIGAPGSPGSSAQDSSFDAERAACAENLADPVSRRTLAQSAKPLGHLSEPLRIQIDVALVESSKKRQWLAAGCLPAIVGLYRWQSRRPVRAENGTLRWRCRGRRLFQLMLSCQGQAALVATP